MKKDENINIHYCMIYIHKLKKINILLAYSQNIMYTIKCCGMIALKREVAALPKGTAGFPWSECQEGRFGPA